MFGHVTMFAELYGKKAAALYTQAQDYQKTARFYYGKVRSLSLCFAFHRLPIHSLAFIVFLCVRIYATRAVYLHNKSLVQAEDTYFQANNWASYDDWRRARDQWDYFCKFLNFVVMLSTHSLVLFFRVEYSGS
jgi:hypothetical protein